MKPITILCKFILLASQKDNQLVSNVNSDAVELANIVLEKKLTDQEFFDSLLEIANEIEMAMFNENVRIPTALENNEKHAKNRFQVIPTQSLWMEDYQKNSANIINIGERGEIKGVVLDRLDIFGTLKLSFDDGKTLPIQSMSVGISPDSISIIEIKDLHNLYFSHPVYTNPPPEGAKVLRRFKKEQVVESILVSLMSEISNLYDKELSFMSESLQNVERSGSTKVWVEYGNDYYLVRDNGIGVRDEDGNITDEALINFWKKHKSGWKEEIQKEQKPFGRGFLSCLILFDRIEIKCRNFVGIFEWGEFKKLGEKYVAEHGKRSAMELADTDIDKFLYVVEADTPLDVGTEVKCLLPNDRYSPSGAREFAKPTIVNIMREVGKHRAIHGESYGDYSARQKIAAKQEKDGIGDWNTCVQGVWINGRKQVFVEAPKPSFSIEVKMKMNEAIHGDNKIGIEGWIAPVGEKPVKYGKDEFYSNGGIRFKQAGVQEVPTMVQNQWFLNNTAAYLEIRFADAIDVAANRNSVLTSGKKWDFFADWFQKKCREIAFQILESGNDEAIEEYSAFISMRFRSSDEFAKYLSFGAAEDSSIITINKLLGGLSQSEQLRKVLEYSKNLNALKFDLLKDIISSTNIKTKFDIKQISSESGMTKESITKYFDDVKRKMILIKEKTEGIIQRFMQKSKVLDDKTANEYHDVYSEYLLYNEENDWAFDRSMREVRDFFRAAIFDVESIYGENKVDSYFRTNKQDREMVIDIMMEMVARFKNRIDEIETEKEELIGFLSSVEATASESTMKHIQQIQSKLMLNKTEEEKKEMTEEDKQRLKELIEFLASKGVDVSKFSGDDSKEEEEEDKVEMKKKDKGESAVVSGEDIYIYYEEGDRDIKEKMSIANNFGIKIIKIKNALERRYCEEHPWRFISLRHLSVIEDESYEGTENIGTLNDNESRLMWICSAIYAAMIKELNSGNPSLIFSCGDIKSRTVKTLINQNAKEYLASTIWGVFYYDNVSEAIMKTHTNAENEKNEKGEFWRKMKKFQYKKLGEENFVLGFYTGSNPPKIVFQRKSEIAGANSATFACTMFRFNHFGLKEKVIGAGDIKAFEVIRETFVHECVHALGIMEHNLEFYKAQANLNRTISKILVLLNSSSHSEIYNISGSGSGRINPELVKELGLKEGDKILVTISPTN